MKDREILSYCLESLKRAGAEKSQCNLTKAKKYEMNVEDGKISLLRTTFNIDLGITAIKEGKKGDISINKLDKESLDEAIENVIELSKVSQLDPAYDIAPAQQPGEFDGGDEHPDLDKMHRLLKGFAENAYKAFPKIRILESVLEFNRIERYYANSNGVDYKASKGVYRFTCTFSAKDGEKSSSFNYTGLSLRELERELLDCGSVRTLLTQSIEHLDTKPLEGKFTGDVIITPDCLNEFITYYVGTYLGDRALISGTSILKDKMDSQVASSKFSLHSKPVSQEISDGYFVTGDGFGAENVTFIDKGILKSFMLSLYGANKTGLERAKNSGDCYVVDPGDKSFEEIVKGIDRGIMIARFSGGQPSSSGDFSGVAKNSYYIEKGEIKYPLSETMISGNLHELFNNIKDISRERVDFGMAILPWMCCSQVTISGK